ncbi:Cupin domain protein [Caballeronia sordidicola]|uniref:Cupin domain protein n=1 Tax=Caballeronia sordidicola TaxID=196367 RepID=A0A158I991_CABSO|nr:cupin domain-containing protein [Caballeronia sordidicola]SAL53135.1 Cupin domain protein [Caballeronia sordidicola]
MKHDRESTLHPADVSYEALRLAPREWVPNNSRLPVLIYRRALDPSTKDLGKAFEALFTRNEWPPQWRDSIFDYHHFHSTAHEALAVISGKGNVIIGGPGGDVISFEAGDVVLLPAGTGHCLQSTEGRFQVVGAYPEGQQWDIRRDALSKEEIAAMEALPFPRSDPVSGSEGPLLDQWK